MSRVVLSYTKKVFEGQVGVNKRVENYDCMRLLRCSAFP